MSIEALSTARLRLVPLAPAHEEALRAIYFDPEVSRHLLTRPTNRSEFQRVFSSALSAAAARGMWALFPSGEHALVGRVGFFSYSDDARPELAFLLGSRWWGRGYATEASRAALSWAFRTHGWAECVSLVRPSNRAAIRVCSKLGMRFEQSLRIAGASASLYRVDSRDFEDAAGPPPSA